MILAQQFHRSPLRISRMETTKSENRPQSSKIGLHNYPLCICGIPFLDLLMGCDRLHRRLHVGVLVKQSGSPIANMPPSVNMVSAQAILRSATHSSSPKR